MSAAPAQTLARNGLADIRHAEFDSRLEASGDRKRQRPSHLSERQPWAVESIAMALELRQTKPFVLQGVTGSGKTEV